MKSFKLQNLTPEEVLYLRHCRGLKYVYAYEHRLIVDRDEKAVEFLILDDILS